MRRSADFEKPRDEDHSRPESPGGSGPTPYSPESGDLRVNVGETPPSALLTSTGLHHSHAHSGGGSAVVDRLAAIKQQTDMELSLFLGESMNAITVLTSQAESVGDAAQFPSGHDESSDLLSLIHI